eukprot:gnl/Chilomastix_cuspidata/1733.p1 GENE.gnl/Chilomastix_cuspidata/1733~~gnl/Chilomastix_cuspidata/1733.p1  ORF type:complete len:513 (+),score=129.87 gnl/Chilomastix_cuspidata/1733:43-1539(+)
MPPLLAAIDQGTTSTRFITFHRSGEVVARAQRPFMFLTPHPGWAELDPQMIFETVVDTMKEVLQMLKEKGHDPSDISSVGLTNQRESVVVWDKETGEPLYNAILWLDTRTKDLCDRLKQEIPADDVAAIEAQTGLKISTYFSALKLRWMVENVPRVRDAFARGLALAGTIDSWLLFKLTGHHRTDVTNASRTLLFDIRRLRWDEGLCARFGVPEAALPSVLPSQDDFGAIRPGLPLAGTVIGSVLGDQQAALFGQLAFAPGEMKATYGTGAFLLKNFGKEVPEASKALLATIGYQLRGERPTYALEGSVAIAGAAINWVTQMGIAADPAELDRLAETVPSTSGVTFVPAFSGLFAPYWRDDARGVLVGLSQSSGRAEVCRAVLEAVAFQTAEVMQLMGSATAIKVDGGMSRSRVFLQIQADIAGTQVEKPFVTESTAFGAASMAGLTSGEFGSLGEIAASRFGKTIEYTPQTSDAEREQGWVRWKDALDRCLGLARFT